MTHLEEKITSAEVRIKELQLLIEHWKTQNDRQSDLQQESKS